ncbi:hypothetical protein F4677DRAFT_390904 [Hypoxylon crocopeplum]|nr:hypothetical protein F4677DRAFT_390904 [Hypoxylon crocopeplum]
MALYGEDISASARAEAPISAAVLIGVMTLYLTLSTAFTFARMYTRYFVHQQLWWDDWMMVLAWLGTIAFCVFQLVMVYYGAGVNVWDVPDDTLEEFLKLFLDIQMVARIAILVARLSILLFYIRIFFPIGTVRSAFWWVIHVVIWANILYTVSLILVTTLQCVPEHLPWGDSCVNQYLILIMASTINIISDIAILVIPIASILKLHTTKRRKWAIWALFAFGTIAPVVSIVRLVYQALDGDGENKTIIYTIVSLLATAEQVVAVIVGSAPVASAAVIRLMWRKLPASPHNRTITERIWPGREARQQPVDSRGIPDPFPITGATLTESAEVLYSSTTAGQSGSNNRESWEMLTKTTSNAERAASRGTSTTADV